jgi:hypothetical protein
MQFPGAYGVLHMHSNVLLPMDKTIQMVVDYQLAQEADYDKQVAAHTAGTLDLHSNFAHVALWLETSVEEVHFEHVAGCLVKLDNETFFKARGDQSRPRKVFTVHYDKKRPCMCCESQSAALDVSNSVWLRADMSSTGMTRLQGSNLSHDLEAGMFISSRSLSPCRCDPSYPLHSLDVTNFRAQLKDAVRPVFRLAAGSGTPADLEAVNRHYDDPVNAFWLCFDRATSAFF